MPEKTSLFEKETEKAFQMSISVPKSLRDLIKERADQHNVSTSYYCRKLFEIYLEYEETIEALAEGRVKAVPVDHDNK